MKKKKKKKKRNNLKVVTLQLFLDVVSNSHSDNVTKRVKGMFSRGKAAWVHHKV